MSSQPHVSSPTGIASFADRHIGPRPADVEAMLARLGFDSLEALMGAAVPGGIRSAAELSLPEAATETQVAQELRDLAARNRPAEPMIGLGYHGTTTPPVVRRNVLEDPSWYTAYTPYQPEISQGRLEALINFQTVIGDLTGLPTANASLLDEGTAAAEAMTLVRRAQRKAAGPFVVDADALPQTIEVVRTRAEAMGIDVVVADVSAGLPAELEQVCGVLVQYPGASGEVRDPRPAIEAAHERGGLAVVACDLLALTLLESPGELGADVAVGSSQRFGVPLFHGGPHAGFMSVKAGLERHLPGRLVGVSVDAEGRPAYRLALQTREQHIRRDKATSNICTAQVLLAVVAGMYAVYHGPEGLRGIARGAHDLAARAAASLSAAGLEILTTRFFDTFRVAVPGRADDVVDAARAEGLHLLRVDDDTVGLSFSEVSTPATLRALHTAFGVTPGPVEPVAALPEELSRTTDFLTHETFHAHRSETQMLRYLRRLSARDYALDRGMIPLGSCTMKLNATTEMEPVSLPGFADLHPFVPAQDAEGYHELVSTLEGWLAEVTGYDRVSIQPNAGSQGELAGLLAIRGYHLGNGDTQRDVCLIPSSAHGTNAASAVMAGMRVVVVKSTDDGSVDLEDLRAQCERHADTLAAIMVTYPSTHGAYEEGITELCEVVHAHGGQVYVDGANLNAMVGLARPGTQDTGDSEDPVGHHVDRVDDRRGLGFVVDVGRRQDQPIDIALDGRLVGDERAFGQVVHRHRPRPLPPVEHHGGIREGDLGPDRDLDLDDHGGDVAAVDHSERFDGPDTGDAQGFVPGVEHPFDLPPLAGTERARGWAGEVGRQVGGQVVADRLGRDPFDEVDGGQSIAAVVAGRVRACRCPVPLECHVEGDVGVADCGHRLGGIEDRGLLGVGVFAVDGSVDDRRDLGPVLELVADHRVEGDRHGVLRATAEQWGHDQHGDQSDAESAGHRRGHHHNFGRRASPEPFGGRCPRRDVAYVGGR